MSTAVSNSNTAAKNSRLNIQNWPWKNWGLSVLGIIVLVILWHFGIVILQKSMPLAALLSPYEALVNLQEMLATGSINIDLWASLRRVFVSLFAALAIGIPIGLAVGSWKLLDAGTSGAFQFLRMVSPLSWMPVAVMLFGIGDNPIYFLLTMTAVWPIILNTSAGVRSLDPRWLNLAKSMSATKTEILFKIIFPGILGHILTGSRLAIGIIWVLLVPCEMLGVTSGLGYFILDTRDRLAYSELMAAIVLIGMLGFMLDSCAKRLQQRWS